MADFLDTRASSNVNVTGFSEKALKGILDAIQKTNSAIERVSGSIDEGNRRAGQIHADDLVRSENSERQSRAAYSAVHDEIDKGLSILDSLKNIVRDALNKFVDISKEMAMKSIRAYDDNTRAMRQNFLTTAQIKDNLIKGDKAKLFLSEMGIKVSSDETKNIVAQLANAGADTNNLNKEQIAAITMMNKVLGTDIKTALTIAKTSSDPTAIIKMAVNATDTVGREATTKLLESVNETWFVQYARQQGGTENALKQLQEAAKKLDSSLGDYGLSADSQKNLLSGLAKITSGQLEKVQEEEIKNLLAISGDAMKSPEKLMEGIQNLITRNDITADKKLDKLRVLEKIPGMDENFMNSLKNAITAQEKGNYKEKSIRSEEENKEAINQAQQGGLVGGFINEALTKFNVFTSKFINGGIFGGISAELNEWMGDSVETGDIVKRGFTMIGKLVSKLIEKVSGGFGKFGGGIMGSLQSSAGRMLVRKIVTSPGFLAAASVAASGFVAYKAISDEAEKQSNVSDAREELDKNKQSILDKTTELERVKKYGAESDIATLEAEIAKLKANIPTLEGKLREAELNSRSNSKKTADEYVENIRKDLVAKQNEATKWETYYLKAKAADDKESMEVYAARMKAANESIEEISANKQALTEYKNTAMASLLDPLNLSVDSMVKLNKYKDLIYSIVLGLFGPIGKIGNDIRLITTNWYKITAKIGSTIGSILSTAKDFGDTISKGVDKAKDFKDTISKGAESLRTKISNIVNPIKDFFKLEWLPQTIKNFIFGGGKEAASKSSWVDNIGNIITNTFKGVRSDFKNWWDNFKLFANGGVVNSATKAVVGEAGKEVIFPLTRPDQIRNVFSQLSNNEKFLLLKELLKSNRSFSTASLSSVLYSILTGKDKLSKQNTQRNSSSTQNTRSNVQYTGDSYDSAVKALESYTGGRLKPAEFVSLFGPIAREDMRRSGIPASVTLAQAALETGWGKSAHADFRNLFGIKGSGDAGSRVVNTHEVYDGVSVKKKDAFAQYSSYLASIEAHSKYLLNAQRKSGLRGLRYGEALTHIFEPNLFAYLLREGGYATSTSYGNKLVSLMKSNNLYRYDLPAGSLSLQGVGTVQQELMKLAEQNLSDSNASQERLNQLREEEYQREIIRAQKEGKPLPKAKGFMSIHGSGPSADSVVKSAGLLSTSEMMTILNEAGVRNAPIMSSYIEQAKKLLASGSDKENIIVLLTEIARYLRTMSVNKNTAVPVSRPPVATYGVSGAR